MNRTVCVTDNELTLLFTEETDRKFIYDESTKDKNILLSMFDDPKNFKWEDIRDENPDNFDGKAGENKYLLIEYKKEIIGVFVHAFHGAKIENMEFHIWFTSSKHTGKGIGSRVVQLMKEYINETYQIKTFMMRPWTKNPRAIRTYEKCGFKVIPNFPLGTYFTPAEIAKYGNGAYSVEETANMIASM